MKKIFFLKFKYIFSVVFIAGAVMLFVSPVDAKSVEISWNVKKDNLTNEVDYFQLQRKTGNSGPWDVVSPYGSISPNDGELVRDVYHYAVQFDTGSETAVHQYKIKTFMKSSQSKETKPVITSTKCVGNQCNVTAVNLEEDENPQAVTNTLMADLKAIISPGQSVRLTKFSVNNIQYNNGRNEVEANNPKIIVAWETRRKGNDNVEEVEILDGGELIKKLSSKDLDANLNNSSAEINLDNGTHYIGIKIISNGFVVSEKEAGLHNGRKYGPIKVIVSGPKEEVSTRQISPEQQEQDEEESDDPNDPTQREKRSDDSTTPAREDNPVEIVMPTALNLQKETRDGDSWWITIDPEGNTEDVDIYEVWYSPDNGANWKQEGIFNDSFYFSANKHGLYGVHVVAGDIYKDEKDFGEQPVEIKLPVVTSPSSIRLFTINGISHSDSMGGQSAVINQGNDITVNWRLISGSGEYNISKFKEILLLYVSHEKVRSIPGICQPNPVPQQNCFGDELASIPASSGSITQERHAGEAQVSLGELEPGIYYIVPMFRQNDSDYYVKGEYVKVEILGDDVGVDTTIIEPAVNEPMQTLLPDPTERPDLTILGIEAIPASVSRTGIRVKYKNNGLSDINETFKINLKYGVNSALLSVDKAGSVQVQYIDFFLDPGIYSNISIEIDSEKAISEENEGNNIFNQESFDVKGEVSVGNEGLKIVKFQVDPSARTSSNVTEQNGNIIVEKKETNSSNSIFVRLGVVDDYTLDIVSGRQQGNNENINVDIYRIHQNDFNKAFPGDNTVYKTVTGKTSGTIVNFEESGVYYLRMVATKERKIINESNANIKPIRVIVDMPILTSFDVNMFGGSPQISWGVDDKNIELIKYFEIWRRQVDINPPSGWKNIKTIDDIDRRQATDDQVATGRYQYGMHVVMKGGPSITEGEYGFPTGNISYPGN